MKIFFLTLLWSFMSKNIIKNLNYAQLVCITTTKLAIPASSALVECVFSKYGSIHSKDRNRLLSTRIERI